MATIAENLQALANVKASLKAALENQNKEPTDNLSTYPGLIDTLENPDDISYCVTVDGESKAYAQLHGQEKVTLTATPNDIRINTSAITSEGYTEGEKEIPAYHSRTGKKFILAGEVVTLTIPRYDYSELQATVSNFNTSMSDSVEVIATTIEDSVYEAKSTLKLADITLDDSTTTINFGITADQKSVLRYFTMKEE